ncbi:Single-stranded DNA-binding protein homolog sam-10 [Caenorhabditis elegans]|uniref:Single-stranded DNA-binding protein homolog sam-10 n=2 Tax=Caenorhabditis elegans TaxID=6239 RepID=SAM10_CAEEL|nr:Single-stranded DNA-binding protein homolog sam-10 [Caenorhabditis elegans]B7FAS6.1 RecName: Full=Single-stranded DNA-binding protein homolog sam-10; AltName: Full=Synaptic vesicle tag abnormal in mechanosensory neurons [Caenorhabditis elegans]CAV31815.1 Single-stranded DNA-binding protein homolog sam-10 [Caenorhabditis elegans]|eukprot:NP_001254379.1 Single-stranded DNA-binding protein homolog sam-10 [Caenorhabditis elegans]
MPPQVIQQQQQSLASEMTARDRLTSYIYEYLQQTGASKTAETFKEEVLSTNPAAGLAAANSTKLSDKSFLLEWWLLFWDLYSAAPERRDAGGDPFSAEAKYFHEAMIGMPPGMNGHFAPPPMGMEMMGGHPGAFGGRFAPGRMPPGAMAPGGMPPGAFPMFPPDPRLQRMAPNQGMRMPPPPVGQPFPGAVGMPRPVGPGAPMDMSGMQRFDFMGGPPPGGGAQPFPGASGSGGMMPNGAHPHMSLNSPSMGVPPADMPPFMGMPPMPPTSSSAMPFGMSSDHQPMSAGPAAAAPGATTAGGPGTPGMIGSVPGPGSVPQVATTSVGSVGTPSSIGQQLHQPKQEITTNGEEIMKTEALTPTGGGGGGSVPPPPPAATAAVSMNGGGPGSAPGSAHSVNNNVNPGTPGSNPLSNPMSNPPLSSGPPPPGSNDAFGKDDNGEISKIREGLLDGFCA